MKLRIRGDSVRLRLKKGEVSRLASGEKIIETTRFPGNDLTYSLELAEGAPDMTASFTDGNLAVKMPTEIIPDWADTDLVSLYSEQELPGGDKLALLVEKDFSCLEPGHHRDCEDDADTYPHPSA